MYCENCGHKMEGSDKFCTKCGTLFRPEGKEHNSATPISEEKWWQRLLKVIYILLYVGGIGLVCVISFSTMPHPTLDGNLSTIQCDNGKSYAPERNSIYLYGDSLSSYDDEHARILCAYDTTNYYSSNYPAPSYKNYIFYPHLNTPDYTSWFFGSLLALFLTWLVLKLIRLGVQYVAIGSKPRWQKEFKKLY